MGVTDHPEDAGAANYGVTDPNVGHMGPNMQRADYVAWAST